MPAAQHSQQQKKQKAKSATTMPPNNNRGPNTPDERAQQLHAALAADDCDDDFRGVAVEYLDATVQHGAVRPDHGIQVNLSGRAVGHSRPITNIRSLTLDVHGSGLFAALPNGLGSAAQMLLPLPARIDREGGSDCATPEWEGKFVLGAKQLSRGRLESTLTDIVAAGDPPFVFELRLRDGRVLGFLPTRASLLQEGLAAPGQRSVRDAGPLADFRRSLLRTYVGYLRWWLMPLLFLAASWLLFLQPGAILPHIPQLIGTTKSGEQILSVATVLPPHPGSMAEAFRLGALHAQMQQRGTSVPSTEALLREVSPQCVAFDG